MGATAPAPPAPAAPGAKERLARLVPAPAIDRLDRVAFAWRRLRVRAVHRVAGLAGLNVVRRADYYSTLPVLDRLEATQERWDRPSAMVGIDVDTVAMRERLAALAERWDDDFALAAGGHRAEERAAFGPGFPDLDARILYFVLREERPAHYLEVGSGVSTHYAALAAERNAKDGDPLRITCVEPYPFPALRTVPDIELVEAEVQDVALERFEALEDGDVLFIDSTHALKIDSDVTFLLLEVLPRLRPGVLVHIHDMPFPYNVPFPASTWLFGERWPVYWNEAMAVQAFLAFNAAFEVVLSTPLLRHEDEATLVDLFDGYVPVAEDPNPPSSLWLRRTG